MIFAKVIWTNLRRNHFGEVWWSQPWRDDPITPKQLRRIQMRRAGPQASIRIPEELYRAILFVTTACESSRKVETKGQAELVITMFTFLDEDVLRTYERWRRIALHDVRCPSCSSRVLLPDTFRHVFCEPCRDEGVATRLI